MSDADRQAPPGMAPVMIVMGEALPDRGPGLDNGGSRRRPEYRNEEH